MGTNEGFTRHVLEMLDSTGRTYLIPKPADLDLTRVFTTTAMQKAVDAVEAYEMETMGQPETRFKEKVQRDLEKIPGIWAIKTQERARRGVPDILICGRGMFIALELKMEGSASALQGYVLDQIQKAGGIALTATPVTWPGIFETLREGLI